MTPQAWICLPAAMLLAALIAGGAARIGRPALGAATALATALLLPGIALALGRLGAPSPLACRIVGALPLLLLPSLRVLSRMPPGQARAAAGLGTARLARLRLLWLPQLGPPALLGTSLAALLDLAALIPRQL